LSEAPSFGKPIILYDIRSAGAEAYLHLAKEVIDGTAGTRSGP
jgi:chromosome partitioning protein